MSRMIGCYIAILAVALCAGRTIAGPITDTVIVNGKEWAQVDLFVGLSWSEINTVCPVGVCGNGTLTGFDMSGWTWASTEDLNSLFNDYSADSSDPNPNLLGPGPSRVTTESTAPNSYAQLFYLDGWRATSSVFFESRETMGRTADSPDYFAGIGVSPSFLGAGTSNMAGTNYSDAFWNPGAWFSRPDPAAAVSSPATVALFAIGLAALGHHRRSRRRET
jgi:hypothetical protein